MSRIIERFLMQWRADWSLAMSWPGREGGKEGWSGGKLKTNGC